MSWLFSLSISTNVSSIHGSETFCLEEPRRHTLWPWSWRRRSGLGLGLEGHGLGHDLESPSIVLGFGLRILALTASLVLYCIHCRYSCTSLQIKNCSSSIIKTVCWFEGQEHRRVYRCCQRVDRWVGPGSEPCVASRDSRERHIWPRGGRQKNVAVGGRRADIRTVSDGLNHRRVVGCVPLDNGFLSSVFDHGLSHRLASLSLRCRLCTGWVDMCRYPSYDRHLVAVGRRCHGAFSLSPTLSDRDIVVVFRAEPQLDVVVALGCRWTSFGMLWLLVGIRRMSTASRPRSACCTVSVTSHRLCFVLALRWTFDIAYVWTSDICNKHTCANLIHVYCNASFDYVTLTLCTTYPRESGIFAY